MHEYAIFRFIIGFIIEDIELKVNGSHYSEASEVKTLT